MNSFKRALEKFIEANLDKLLAEFYDHCYFCGNSDGPSYINKDSEILNHKAFEEWVEEKYTSEINALEDQLKDEEKILSEQSREYANQVMADYKYAQTGKY